jgi:hypothetical protein
MRSHEFCDGNRTRGDADPSVPKVRILQPSSRFCDFVHTSRDLLRCCGVKQRLTLPLERTVRLSRRRYHALGDAFSPLDHVGPETSDRGNVLTRKKTGETGRSDLAQGATEVTTASYTSRVLLREARLTISRLCPRRDCRGQRLEHADELTITGPPRAAKVSSRASLIPPFISYWIGTWALAFTGFAAICASG